MKTLLKGVLVGGTMLVPGVSGGSMAMILGVYDKLVSAVGSFGKHRKENFLFLALFSAGGILGMLLLARPLLQVIRRFPMPAQYFFLGAVAGGVPLIFRQAQIRRLAWRELFFTVAGFLAVLLFAALPSGSFQTELGSGFRESLYLLLTGVLAAAALVLPGISVSYLLLLLGLYDRTMRAVSGLELSFLLPLGIGLLLGILLTARLLEQAMTKHPQPAYLVILGFVLGSMAEVFPGLPAGKELFWCAGMLAAGFGGIRLLSAKTPVSGETAALL